MRVALYARVSTNEQHAENQLLELRRYVVARGWPAGVEFVDEGVSGAKTRRPALDRLMLAARRRQIDAVVCWRLDRLGRNLAHLPAVVNEWTALGVAFISLGEGNHLGRTSETLDLAQPSRQLVPTRENAAHQHLHSCVQYVGGGVCRHRAQESNRLPSVGAAAPETPLRVWRVL